MRCPSAMYSQTGMSSNWLRFPANASGFPPLPALPALGFVLSAVSTLTAGTPRPHLPASRGGTIRAGVALTPGAAKDPGLPPVRVGPPPGVIPGGGPGASPGAGNASAGTAPNDAFSIQRDRRAAICVSHVRRSAPHTSCTAFAPSALRKAHRSGRAQARQPLDRGDARPSRAPGGHGVAVDQTFRSTPKHPTSEKTRGFRVGQQGLPHRIGDRTLNPVSASTPTTREMGAVGSAADVWTVAEFP